MMDNRKEEFYKSVDTYATGFQKTASDHEYELYHQLIDSLKKEAFNEPEKIPKFVVEAEKNARIKDYRRRMTEDVNADICTIAVEHLKYALFDSKPYMQGGDGK